MAATRYMLEALALARRAQGRTSPNPVVGAVVVSKGKVCGRGYHLRAGSAHAEVMALEEASERAHGADLYVTLEPCNHQGKTPPCTEAILAAGIKRVFIAMKDPNPEVCGKGAERLRKAGLEVQEGMCEAEAEELLRHWRFWLATGRPFTHGRLKLSLSGEQCPEGLASGAEVSSISQAKFHRELLRYEASIELLPNPFVERCETYLSAPRLRVILASSLSKAATELEAEGASLPNCVVFAPEDAEPEAKSELEQLGARVHILKRPYGSSCLPELLEVLGEAAVYSIFIRSAELTKLFIEAELLNELSICRLPFFTGESGQKPFPERSLIPSNSKAWTLAETRRSGREALATYLLK